MDDQLSSHSRGDELPSGLAKELGYKLYWGDLHGHSNVSSDWMLSGGADPAFFVSDYFQKAVERDLVFALITDHAEDISDDAWTDMKDQAASFDQPGYFIPFVGYELTYRNGPANAWNVMFPNVTEAGPVYAHESYRGIGKSCPDDFMVSREELWSRLSNTGAIGFLAHPTNIGEIDLDFGPHERAAMVSLEVYSTGGRAGEERYAVEAPRVSITHGLRLGVVGGGNNHGIKSGGGPGLYNAYAGPGVDGLTGVLLKEFTREALFDGLRKRRTYGVCNTYHDRGLSERIRMSFDVNGHLMGEEFDAPVNEHGVAALTFNVSALPDNTPIRKLALFRVKNGQQVLVGDAEASSGVFQDNLQPDETGVYFAVAYLQDINEAQAWTSPVWITARHIG